MKINPLFNLGLQFLATTHSAPLRFAFMRNAQGIGYLLHHLPHATSCALAVPISGKSRFLRLANHHLSFYEEYDPQNPLLSEYHYTAHFLDSDKHLYRLHVYFNNNNELTIAPLLAAQIAPHKFQCLPLTHALLYRLRKLALSQSRECIALLNGKGEESVPLMTERTRGERHCFFQARMRESLLEEVQIRKPGVSI